MSSGYHQGERLAQARAGETGRAEHLGRSIRDTVPAVAASFLAERQLLVVGAADADGRLWATVLAGDPGFVSVPDERTILVAASVRPDDPLAGVLGVGVLGVGVPQGSTPAAPVQVGTIALEPATRRRMRVNGLASADPSGLRLRTEQVFSNCPKYIQKRRPVRFTPTTEPGPARWSASLDAADAAFVSGADTFFLASADAEGNVDASHRGGLPGFVEVLSPTRLRWREYPGNGAYMTLGNLELNPRAGLVLPDWESGDLLLLTGEARTDWASHAVEFSLAAAVRLPGAVPLRWTGLEFSPALAALG